MEEEESSFSLFLISLADNRDRFLVRSGFQFKTGFRRALTVRNYHRRRTFRDPMQFVVDDEHLGEIRRPTCSVQ